MGSDLKQTFSVEDVFEWLKFNGFEEVSQAFYGMYFKIKRLVSLLQLSVQDLFVSLFIQDLFVSCLSQCYICKNTNILCVGLIIYSLWARYIDRFFIYVLTDEGIDGEAMSCLTENALQSLVARIGPRMKLFKAIKGMQAHSTSSDSQSEDSTSSLVSSHPSWQDEDSESLCFN